VASQGRSKVVTRLNCRAQNRHGASCRAFALPDKDFCVTHEPSLEAARREACRRGGTAAAKLRALQGRRLKLDSPAALLKFNASLCQDTLSGSVDPSVSKAVSYALANQLKLLETSELERRLGELEQLQRQKPLRLEPVK
jgi:hypothetical protein